jgi:hypothetical protein
VHHSKIDARLPEWVIFSPKSSEPQPISRPDGSKS